VNPETSVVPGVSVAPDVSVAEDARIRLRAGLLSLVVAVLMLAAKYQAYRMTRSTAVLSDALESIVNVVAAVFALGGLVFAGRPADRNHPYGHGKIEFFSAAFEGGLIAFASVVIVYEVVLILLAGAEVRQISTGILIVLATGLVNLVLGWYLVRTGRRYQSLTLVADGKHVIADFWTSAGVVVGLLLVHLTGLAWLDPVVALLVALSLMWTGWRLVRHAAGGLLDEEDPVLLNRVLNALQKYVGHGVIRVHHLRAIRSGRFHHVEAHLVVPEFWSVERAHEVSEDVAASVIRDLGVEGEMVFHTDPCHRIYCAVCDLEACPIRREPFFRVTPLTLEEAVQPDMPRPAP
jgi:cation diffusion facilitator family transporter